MINFVTTEGSYKEVLNSFIQPILPYLDNYEVNLKTKDNVVNVIFFTEDGVFKEIGAEKGKGVNVFITHGIADKNWRTAQKTGKFDYVFVTGDLWVDKLVKQGMNKDKIKVGGYTRMENIFNQRDNYVKNNNGKKTILFAPTHTASITTYQKLDNLIERLKEDYNVLISEHPANRDNKDVTSNQFLEADVVVGDFGSSMYEAWSLDKPVVLADWLVKDEIHELYPDSFEDYIYQNGIDYHANSEEEFIELIEVACNSGIKQNAIDFIDGIFNRELRGNSGKVTADILNKIRRLL